jgi:type II secretory pathway predicted ATPase ExeA
MRDDIADPLDHFRSVAPEEQRQRIEVMQRVRGAYFRHPKHDEVAEHVDELLEHLLEHTDSRVKCGSEEASGIAIIGASGAGKSTMLRRIFLEHPAFPRYGVIGSRCPIVTVKPEGACTLDRFAIDTLRKLGMPVQDVPRQEQRMAHMVRDQLRLMGAKVLHIDEAHHITQPANSIQIKKILNTFKCLMIDDEWPIGLILSGIPELRQVLEGERQVARRLAFVPLAGLTVASDARKVGKIVQQLAGLAKLGFSTVQTDVLAPRIIHAGGYQLGCAIERIHEAIRVRLKRNLSRLSTDTPSPDPLTLDDFATAYARKTGVEAQDNPFLAHDWEATDPFRVLNGPQRTDDKGDRPSPRSTKKGG